MTLTHLPAELEARRSELQTTIISALEAPLTQTASLTTCTKSPSFIQSYTSQLQSKGLWPLHTIGKSFPLRTTLDKMIEIQIAVCFCAHESCEPCELAKQGCFEAKFVDFHHEYRNKKKGVCIDCVKSGRMSRAEKGCRESHPEVFVFKL